MSKINEMKWKTKTAEIKIAELGTEIVHHRHHDSRYLAHQLILGQKVKGQGHRVSKCKSIAASCYSDLCFFAHYKYLYLLTYL